MQILLKRSHRLKMAAVKRRIKARINIINETLTVPGIIISNNMEEEVVVVKVDLKAREVITIRVDMAMVAPLLETREQSCSANLFFSN